MNVKNYGILLIDTGERVRSWNQGSAFVYGYAAEEIIGQHFSSLYHEEDQKTGLPQQHLQEVIETRKIE